MEALNEQINILLDFSDENENFTQGRWRLLYVMLTLSYVKAKSSNSGSQFREYEQREILRKHTKELKSFFIARLMRFEMKSRKVHALF